MTVNAMTLARRTAKAAVLPIGLLARRSPEDVVILLYHRLGSDRREVHLPPAEFERQLADLVERERVLAPDDALMGASAGGVLVTFDDGYRDFHEQALPLLEKYRVPAVLYLATGLVVDDGSEGRRSGDGLTWSQVQEALDSGLVTVGAHTHGHVDLARVPAEVAEDEVRQSKELIEERLGIACRHFSYPYAVSSPAAERVVRDLFDTAARDAWRTNRPGRVDRYRWGRTPVLRSDGRAFFRAKVKGRLDGEALVYRVLGRGPWRRARGAASARTFGAAERSLERLAAVAERAPRDPTVLGEAARKVRSRATTRPHQRRRAIYPARAQRPEAALAGVLRASEAAVRRELGRASLLALINELGEYERPDATEGILGPAYLEIHYCLVRMMRPRAVVETGVGHGYSTAVLLHGLEENDFGMLRSVDFPALRRGADRYIGAAIPPRLRSSSRWSLTIAPDRRALPEVIAEVGTVDLAFYDSDKSYDGMMRSWSLLWEALRPGGVLVADDVEAHDAFLDLTSERSLSGAVVRKPRTGIYAGPDEHYVGIVAKP
jgi:peptidoglycan/xylan/chitin deacetylase (PgdA/CDA1 family)/predicted O-methyltransferase YrrM